MLANVSYECAIEDSIGSVNPIEYGNGIFYRIKNSVEYSIGLRICYSIFYRIRGH